jgi:septal ring factor EnvC (AmiA/AmiB activator)
MLSSSSLIVRLCRQLQQEAREAKENTELITSQLAGLEKEASTARQRADAVERRKQELEGQIAMMEKENDELVSKATYLYPLRTIGVEWPGLLRVANPARSLTGSGNDDSRAPSR